MRSDLPEVDSQTLNYGLFPPHNFFDFALSITSERIEFVHTDISQRRATPSRSLVTAYCLKMAEKAGQEQAAKDRIVSHMNKDHHDSVSMQFGIFPNSSLTIPQIVRYLEHYGKLSSLSAYSGRMTDVDLHGLALSCHGRTYRVPIEPAMSSYREARERVVELDKDCRKALRRSDVTVKRYVPPNNLVYAIGFLIISTTFVSYSQRWWFAKGGPVEYWLGSTFADFSWTIQPWLIAAMVAIHGSEAMYFALYRLRPHSVNPRSSIWWLWMLSCFVEGQFAYRRFDDLVKLQREKQKH